MKLEILLLIALLLLIIPLCGMGSISEIWKTIESSSLNDEYGGLGASLDYNGDGIDDLIVVARTYRLHPTVREYGRVEIFYGKEEGFGDSPDLVINAIKPDSLFIMSRFSNFISCGDVNGDGFDDFASTLYSTSIDMNTSYDYLEIFCGGPAADTLVDIIVNPPDSMDINNINRLGDVNGDGFDDIGIGHRSSGNTVHGDRYLVLFGGSFTYKLIKAHSCNYNPYISGIGDINSDGYNDMGIAYGKVINDQWYYESEIFFGSPNLDPLTDIYMSQYWPGNGHNIPCWSNPTYIGDWNGDGFDDCIAYDLEGVGLGLWTGGPSDIPNIHTILEYPLGLRDTNFDFGDLNGDGKYDFVVAEPTVDGSDGAFFVFIGSRNGTMDYYGPNFPLCSHAGWTVCVGDYDNDGYDDIAIGAIGEENSCPRGKVYVFRGSASLVEQNPEINPSENIPVKPQLEFNIYPNPSKSKLNVKITDPYKGNYKLEIFNIKGQKVYSINTGKITKEYNTVVDLNKLKLTNGVYLFKLNDALKSHAVKKITITK